MFGKCWNLRVWRFYGPRNMRLKPSDVGEVFITDHFVYLSSIHSLKRCSYAYCAGSGEKLQKGPQTDLLRCLGMKSLELCFT